MTLDEFINEVGMIAVELYPKYKILPSLCIAQALVESNKADYQKGLLKLSGLATECHNYFGMKWNSTSGTDRKAYKTKEWDKNSQKYIEVIAYFRKYPDLRSGIEGYMKFMTYKRYKPLVGQTDWKTCTRLVKECGWATSPVYTENLNARITRLQLFKYDEIALGKPAEQNKNYKPTLKVGMNDDDLGADYIKSWKTFLTLLMKYNGVIDGYYGEDFKKSVMEYQKSKNLVPDGIIGAKTWGSLPS